MIPHLLKTFTIGDLEKYCDIRAHTLRTWEYRYDIPQPKRNNGNSRNYSLGDLRQVLNISILNKNGYKISSLCTLSAIEIDYRLTQLKDEAAVYLKAIADLIFQMFSLDGAGFENVLNNCFSEFSLPTVMNCIIYPFLRKTNLLWYGTGLTEEHLAVTIIRKKIMYGIEVTECPDKVEKKVVLFLAGTKQLDLALLYLYYELKRLGTNVIYLGNDVSISNLEMILSKSNPDWLYTYVSRRNDFYIGEITDLIDKHFPDTKLIISNDGDHGLSASSKGVIFTSFENAHRLLVSPIAATIAV